MRSPAASSNCRNCPSLRLRSFRGNSSAAWSRSSSGRQRSYAPTAIRTRFPMLRFVSTRICGRASSICRPRRTSMPKSIAATIEATLGAHCHVKTVSDQRSFRRAFIKAFGTAACSDAERVRLVGPALGNGFRITWTVSAGFHGGRLPYRVGGLPAGARTNRRGNGRRRPTGVPLARRGASKDHRSRRSRGAQGHCGQARCNSVRPYLAPDHSSS